MADDEGGYKITFLRAEFLALIGNIPIALLRTELQSLALTVPITDARMMLMGNGVIVEWLGEPPTAQDRLDVRAKVAAFVGGATTAEPFVYNSFAVATSASTTPVVKINETTTPLDAGTYQVIWTSSLRMQAVIANTGISATLRLTRSDGVFVEQDDAWDRAVKHAYNGALTFQIQAGQTITSLLTFQRLGASGTAELSGARITVDKIS
jgi:hypothetical protein